LRSRLLELIATSACGNNRSDRNTLFADTPCSRQARSGMHGGRVSNPLPGNIPEMTDLSD